MSRNEEMSMVMIVFDKSMKQRNEEATPACKKNQHCDAKSMQERGRQLVKKYQNRIKIVVPVCEMCGDEMETAHNLALGMEIGDYHFDKYQQKKDKEFAPLEMAVFQVENPAAVKEAYKPLAALANGIRYARDLVNEPLECFDRTSLAMELKRLEYLGLEVDEKNGLILMEWKGNRTKKDTLLLAGSDRKTSAVGAAICKIFALQKRMLNIKAVLNIEPYWDELGLEDKADVVYVNRLENDMQVEAEIMRLYEKGNKKCK